MTEERANSNFKVLVTQIHIKSIEEYLQKNTINITKRQDLFVSSHTTSYTESHDSSFSGGGGGGFSSSGGSSGGGHSSDGGRHG